MYITRFTIHEIENDIEKRRFRHTLVIDVENETLFSKFCVKDCVQIIQKEHILITAVMVQEFFFSFIGHSFLNALVLIIHNNIVKKYGLGGIQA